MSKDPIRDALADAIRNTPSPGMWTTTVKEEIAPAKVVVDLSDERPIHLVCGSVIIKSNEAGAEAMIEELRKAVRMVRAANAPQPPRFGKGEVMSAKVWLDDERDPKRFKGWEDAIWVTTPEEAIELLEAGLVAALSLDNDLGLPDDEVGQPRDGYRVACWLEARVANDEDFMAPDVLNAHTANSVNGPKMEAAFKSIRRMMNQR